MRRYFSAPLHVTLNFLLFQIPELYYNIVIILQSFCKVRLLYS